MQNTSEPQSSEKSSLGRRVAQNVRNKLTKKALKVGGKALIKVALIVCKWLFGVVLAFSAPVLFLILGVILAMIVFYMMFFWMFMGFGEGEGKADKEMLQLKEDLVEISNEYKIVNGELVFTVPHELLFALTMNEETNEDKLELARDLAQALKPVVLSTTSVDLKTKHRQITCVNYFDAGKVGYCEPEIEWETTSTKTDLWSQVQTWEGIVDIHYTTDYKGWTNTLSKYETEDKQGKPYSVVTATSGVNPQVLKSHKTPQIDYTLLETIASEHGLGPTDLKMVEVQLASTNAVEFMYSDWKGAENPFSDMYAPTVIGGSSIPSKFVEFYQTAGKTYDVDWYYLAAIHYIATGFSTHSTMLSSTGKIGPMQFSSCLWIGSSYPICKESMTGNIKIPDTDLHDINKIAQYGGYGVDGNVDGIASPMQEADAIYAAAKFLNKNGFSADKEGALLAYSNSATFVKKVVKSADMFMREATYFGDGQVNPDGFISPTYGYVSSTYGWRTIGGKRDWHQGVDIANSEGTPIVAVADGEVYTTTTTCPRKGYYGNNCGYGWGNYVWIKHEVNGKTYEAVYAHLSAVTVHNGQKVSQNQVIGAMGTSGSSTGVHLHFEIHTPYRAKDNSRAFNPELIFTVTNRR